MKTIRKIAALICLLCMLFPAALAGAEEPAAAVRGLEELQTASNWKNIVPPQDGSWLDEWKTLYARRAWYAPSLFVECMPEVNSGYYQPFLFEGTEVTVLAEENDMSCILYRGENYKLYAGWIQSIRLLDEFPGATCEIGDRREGGFNTLPEVTERWSSCWLPTTEQPYTVLGETVKNCVGFTFEYQLIAENTGAKWMLWGPRSLWVSDGENWTSVGAFPYDENGTVRVQVWLPEPMDVAGIATVAHCHAPNIFDFRQTAHDFLIEKE